MCLDPRLFLSFTTSLLSLTASLLFSIETNLVLGLATSFFFCFQTRCFLGFRLALFIFQRRAFYIGASLAHFNLHRARPTGGVGGTDLARLLARQGDLRLGSRITVGTTQEVQQPVGRAPRNAWAAVNEQALRTITRQGMDGIAGLLGAPATAPAPVPSRPAGGPAVAGRDRSTSRADRHVVNIVHRE